MRTVKYLDRERKNTAIEQFGGILIDDKECLKPTLDFVLKNELARNKYEYEALAKRTFDNFVTRNQAFSIELRGEEVEKEIMEYFKQLLDLADQYNVSNDTPLILKKSDNGNEIDGVAVPTLYKLEIGNKLPTKAGYFILSKDEKSVEVVYTDDYITDYIFTNIMNENDVYTLSPKNHIVPTGIRVNGDSVKFDGENVFDSAVENRNDLERNELEDLSFAFEDNAENSKYNINELVNLANQEFDDHKILKCKDCGKYFIMSQERCDYFTKTLGFPIPKRCISCRDRRRNGD